MKGEWTAYKGALDHVGIRLGSGCMMAWLTAFLLTFGVSVWHAFNTRGMPIPEWLYGAVAASFAWGVVRPFRQMQRNERP